MFYFIFKWSSVFNFLQTNAGFFVLTFTLAISIIINYQDYIQKKKEISSANKRIIFNRPTNRKLISLSLIFVFSVLGFIFGVTQLNTDNKNERTITGDLAKTKNTGEKTYSKTDILDKKLDESILKLSKINLSLDTSKSEIDSLKNELLNNFIESKNLLQTLNTQTTLATNRLPRIIYIDLEISWSIYGSAGALDDYLGKIKHPSLDDKIVHSTQRRFILSEQVKKYYPILFLGFKYLNFQFIKGNDSVNYITNIHPTNFSDFKSSSRFYNESDFNIYRNATFIYDKTQKTITFKITNCPVELFSATKSSISLLDLNNSTFRILINRDESGIAYELNSEIQPKFIFLYSLYNTNSQGKYLVCKGKLNFAGYKHTEFVIKSNDLTATNIIIPQY